MMLTEEALILFPSDYHGIVFEILFGVVRVPFVGFEPLFMQTFMSKLATTSKNTVTLIATAYKKTCITKDFFPATAFVIASFIRYLSQGGRK